MVRYWVSLVFFLAIIVLASLGAGLRLIFLLDFLSLLIVVVLPFFFSSILFGLKNICSAFSIPFKKDAEKAELIAAGDLLNFYGKVIWLTALLSVIISFVGMMVNLEDSIMIGPNIALMVISLFYSGIITVAVVLPLTALIKNKLTGGLK